MYRKLFYIILVIAVLLSIGGILYHNTFIEKNVPATEQNELTQKKETDETKTDGDIIQIPVETVKGITPREAEQLCYNVLGEKDEETGFTFSFGTASAVERNKKQYYVVRVSWLVNNSHMSYIGDFFVSADGKEIYDGLALPDEYIMENIIWSE